MGDKDFKLEMQLFLEFMWKYSHVDLQLLTLRQLLSQFERETDSLLHASDRRQFKEIAICFCRCRTKRRVPSGDSMSTPAKLPRSEALVASPAGSDCSQVSLDGITNLVRQSGARLVTSNLAVDTTPPTSAAKRQSVEEAGRIRLPQSINSLSSLPSFSSSSSSSASSFPSTSTVTNANSGFTASIIRLPQRMLAPSSGVTPVTMATSIVRVSVASDNKLHLHNKQQQQQQQQQQAPSSDKHPLSDHFSNLLRINKETGLGFPKQQLAEVSEVKDKVAVMENWLARHGFRGPLTVEAARQFANRNNFH